MKLVHYRKAARKGLKKMPNKLALKFLKAFDVLAENPENGDLDIKNLKNRPGFRLRTGDWRAVFIVTNDTLEVLDIDIRGEIYK